MRIRKPDPRHLTETIGLAGGDAASAVMVGDSRTDIDTAKAAGIPVVAVDFGYTDRHVREFEPSKVISHFDELTVDLAERLIAAAQAADGKLDFKGGRGLYRGALRPKADGGRLAQRESTPFTRVGSQVQSLHRPPFSSRNRCLESQDGNWSMCSAR